MTVFLTLSALALAAICLGVTVWVYLQTQLQKFERNDSDTANRNPDNRLP